MIDKNKIHSKPKREAHVSGFTLVEIAIVVVIAGLAAFAVVNSYTSLNGKIRASRTALHLSTIEDALAIYVERNFRLPCPMRGNFTGLTEPYGSEAGSGANGGTIPANCPILEGLVPFKTLGLSAEFAHDGYGHFITYRIARAQGRDQNIAANVHENCRSRPWFQNDMAGAATNINAALAQFCCRAQEGGVNDLDIEYRPFVGAAPQNMWRLAVDNNAARYANVNTPFASVASSALNRNNTHPIYVLVSHGRNGIGAFLPSGLGGRNPGFTGTDEGINGTTASNRFIIGPTRLQENTAGFYDDKISWGTQDSLLNRTGRLSCHSPAR